MRQRMHCRSFGAGTELALSQRKPTRLCEPPKSDARIRTSNETTSRYSLDLGVQGFVGFQFRLRLGSFHRAEQDTLLLVFGFPRGRVHDLEVVVASPNSHSLHARSRVGRAYESVSS